MYPDRNDHLLARETTITGEYFNREAEVQRGEVISLRPHSQLDADQGSHQVCVDKAYIPNDFPYLIQIFLQFKFASSFM